MGRTSPWVRPLAWSLVASAGPLLAGDLLPLQQYFENTLIWKNQVTGATGRIWLNPARWKLHAIGRYFLSGTLPPRNGTL